jgi:hypothetical protein
MERMDIMCGAAAQVDVVQVDVNGEDVPYSMCGARRG